MRDPLTFEARLEDALDRYGAVAPTTVDSQALAASLAEQPRHPLSWPSLPSTRAKGARLALVLGLLAAASAIALLAAGSLLRPNPVPLGGGGRILVTYPVSPGTLLTIDGATVNERSVDVSGCPRLVASADAVATTTRFVGIQFGNFDGAVSSPIRLDYAGGERWSPGNRTLALMNFTDSSLTFVWIEGGDATHPVTRRLPLHLAGPPTPGYDAVAFDGAFSADGRRFLLETDVVSDDPSAGRRLSIIDVGAGDPRPLAILPASARDAWLRTPAWSPDGTRIAALATHDGVRQLALVSTSTGDVRWLHLPAALAADASITIEAWSPDGNHVAVWTDGQLALVDATTGAWATTPITAAAEINGARPDDGRHAAITPDGRRVAIVRGSVLTNVDMTTGRVVARDLASAITSWSPDGSALAVLDGTTAAQSVRVLVYDPWSGAPPSVAATIPGDEAGWFNAPRTDGPCLQWMPRVAR